LLVEKRPEPLELVGSRQILGRNLLVEGAGEHAIAELFWVVENGRIRPPGLAGFGCFVAFGFSIELVGIGKIGRVLRLAFLTLGHLVLGDLLLPLRSVLARFGLLVPAVLVLVTLRVVLLGFALGQFLSELELAKHVAQQTTERLLVLAKTVHAVERLAGPLFDPWPPDLHEGP